MGRIAGILSSLILAANVPVKVQLLLSLKHEWDHDGEQAPAKFRLSHPPMLLPCGFTTCGRRGLGSLS